MKEFYIDGIYYALVVHNAAVAYGDIARETVVTHTITAANLADALAEARAYSVPDAVYTDCLGVVQTDAPAVATHNAARTDDLPF